MRNILTAGLLLAGFTTAHAQNITPGIGGVAITGQSGAGVYIPWNGGSPSIGAPGVGSYNLGSQSYTSPFSWAQYNNPTAYNFNTGSFNYNNGFGNGFPVANTFGTQYGYPNGNAYLPGAYNTTPVYGYNGYSGYGTSLGNTRYSVPVLNTINGVSGGRLFRRWR